MLRSDWCHYSDAYFILKGRITVERDKGAQKKN